MISGLGREGRLDGVVGILDRMTKHGCRPNPRVCNAVINGFVRASKLEYAIRFFGGMVNNLVKEMLQKGWKPDTITYSLLMNGLCQGKLDMPSTSGSKPLREGFQARCEDAQDLVTHNTIMKDFYKVKILKRHQRFGIAFYKMVYYQIASPIILPLRVFVLATESGAIGFLDEAVDRGVLPTAITWNILVREVLDNRALT
ncbi:Pentatricopeptide repeat-containing protein [Vitis vinifera]|uniref:Pentatricopeptide repeat-containing protein n=1 Tax=Vitis vinifera TaxID=29760 RepID=A0A438BY54_VITVI|nr:Pentatricopeptide repeat-containing protein [Vitis vinifera]